MYLSPLVGSEKTKKSCRVTKKSKIFFKALLTCHIFSEKNKKKTKKSNDIYNIKKKSKKKLLTQQNNEACCFFF